MEITPETQPWQSIYKIMIGSILPRPIGWISSIDASGRPNLAPFSFFNPVCANPPHVLFCPMIRGVDAQKKDTLRNVRANGEFVVNIVLGHQPGAASVVIGRVVHLHVSDQVLVGGDIIDLARLKPIGRLAGNAYCRLTELFEMPRPPSQIKS